jgi:hypothetical protein
MIYSAAAAGGLIAGLLVDPLAFILLSLFR